MKIRVRMTINHAKVSAIRKESFGDKIMDCIQNEENTEISREPARGEST